MLEHLLDISIRSVILAAAAALVLASTALFRRRSAAIEHAVWASVVCGMLALALYGRALPRISIAEWKRPAAAPPRAVKPSAETEPSLVSSPRASFPGVIYVSREFQPLTRPKARTLDWSGILFNTYLAIAAVLLARLMLGMALAWVLLAKSRAIARGVFESSFAKVPLAVGWLHPMVLLPAAWRQWEPAKLKAVLAHEAAHVRRRDGLMVGLAGINRSIFWFHPLAWRLERRLALLAELACDEACVAELGDRRGYAGLLIEMAGTVQSPRGRLIWPVFSMAAGSHLRQRVDAILAASAVSKGLSWGAHATLLGCAIPTVFAVGAASIDTPPVLPPVWTVRSPFTTPAPPPPRPPSNRLLAQAEAGAARPGTRLEFEVASIRPAAPTAPAAPPNPTGGGFAPLPPPPPPPGGGGCLPRFTTDAIRVDRLCVSLRELIDSAFDIAPQRILTQDWTDGARFDISARLPAGATPQQVPAMLESLLNDRFGLKFHRETREWPVNALVVSKSGLKIKPAASESDQPAWVAAAAASNGPFGEGHIGGVRFRSLAMPAPGGPPAMVWQAPGMGFVRRSSAGSLGDTIHYEAPSITPEGMATLVQVAGPGLDPPVLDMTGLTGRYQVSLDLSMADLASEVRAHPGDVAAVQRAWLDMIENGLKKLGLELQPRKAPLETIVIDHLEKTPTAN